MLATAALNPPKDGLGRWTLADTFIVGLLLVVAVSQNQAGGLRPLTMPEIARKWLLPYLMGRWLLASAADVPAATRLIVRVLLVLSAYAVVEAGIKVNILNKALGKSYDLLEEGEGYRWGMKRAQAMFDHPIFFGMALVLLLPWALEAGRQARAKAAPRWWRLVPWAVSAALFATVSRGPQLAAMGSAAIYYFFRLPRFRVTMAAAALVLGVLAFGVKDQIVELLGKAAGEKSEDVTLIYIEGEEVEYTGTAHRMLLFRVYEKAIDTTGLFGFGTELKGVELEESIAQRFGSIDCHYLLFLLQHGYLGVGAFLILTVTTLLKLVPVARRVDLPQSALAAGLFGSLFAVAVLMVSVYFSPDFAAVWLFSAGLASRLPLLSESLAPRRRAGPSPPSPHRPRPFGRSRLMPRSGRRPW